MAACQLFTDGKNMVYYEVSCLDNSGIDELILHILNHEYDANGSNIDQHVDVDVEEKKVVKTNDGWCSVM